MYDRSLGDTPTSWLDVLNNAVTTAGQVLRPGSPTTVPMYNPASYAASSIASNTGVWVLGLGALALVMMRRR